MLFFFLPPGGRASATGAPVCQDHAYYQNKKGDPKAAAATLESLLNRQPAFADGHLMLADIYAKMGERKKAEEVYNCALGSKALNSRDRSRIEGALQALKDSSFSRSGEDPQFEAMIFVYHL